MWAMRDVFMLSRFVYEWAPAKCQLSSHRSTRFGTQLTPTCDIWFTSYSPTITMAHLEVASPSTPSTPSRRLNKKERLKMLSQITILDATMDGKIVVSLKIEDCSFVDDSSLTLLSMPDGPFLSSEPITPVFHSFVITVQNGQRIYGGSYIFGFKQIARNQENDEHKVIYMSRALVAITIRPIVDQLKKLLEWCINEGGCNPRWLRCLANIRLPQKGKCILIHLPDIKNSTIKTKLTTDVPSYPSSPAKFENITYNEKDSDKNAVAIFRPFSIFPLFDYSFRILLTEILSIDNLLLIYTCALNEVQILIVSCSYYNLMLISECIIALLNPFKWQHVYVPILPSKLGLHYLDAPTPFIMGINSRIRNYIKSTKIACFVDCDNRKVELNMDPSTLYIPPFIEELRVELQEIVNSDPRLCSNFQKSGALKRVSELAQKYNVISEHFTYLDETKLNQRIRILFFKKLKKYILNKYQHFIAYVSDRKEQIKFDSVAYLSDQPLIMRPFLQHFVETQMFATFIDEAGKTITKKQRSFIMDASMADSLYLEDDYDEMDFTIYSDKMIEARFNTAQSINLTELEDVSSQNLLLATMSPSKKRIQANLSAKSQVKSIPSSPAKMVSTALTAQTNWKVVESLLKEVKVRTKRILLSKMGSDDLTSGSTSALSSNYEENTLIAALCDLVERIWSHALTDDRDANSQWEQSNKCPLWSHLTMFHEFQPKEDDSHRRYSKTSISEDHPDSNGGVTWTSLKKRIDSLSQLSLEQNGFLSKKNPAMTKAIPTNLAYDFNSICDMTDIKTDVGKSRAFIRLSLERKLLSKHLRTLLYNQDLLQSQYKRYAFLRCEEEREQFLTHLLTLNAVDLSCFTNTFSTSNLPYTLVLCTTSLFNGYVSITGSFGNTCEHLYIEENQLNFKHKNFGVVYSLSLTINPNTKVYIEQCFLRNNVTNCLYKFECNKWLGKNIDDGSTERLLVGHIVSGSINDHLKKSSHTRSSSIGRNWTRGVEMTSKEEKLSVDDLQTMLGESINHILKFYFSEKSKLGLSSGDSQASPKSISLSSKLSNSSTTLGKVGRGKALSSCQSIVSLLFGERKLLWIISQIFYYGFKNRRSFRKQTFLWDYILRLQCEYKHILPSSMSASERLSTKDFIALVDEITDKAPNYGKDLKFQLFILLSLRDHKLSPNYLKLISRPQLAQLHFDTESFVRDGVLFTFLSQILKSFNEIELKLDSSLTKDI